MLTTPVIEQRAEQPYMAIRTKLAMQDIPAVLPPQIKEVFDWLAKNKLEPAGAPFFRYLAYEEKDNQLLVDVGVPVHPPVAGDNRVVAGAFPAGRYAKTTHTGSYSHLKNAHMFLDDWGKKNGVQWKEQPSEKGIDWGCRIEFYPCDPKKEPDSAKWETDILFLTAP